MYGAPVRPKRRPAVRQSGDMQEAEHALEAPPALASDVSRLSSHGKARAPFALPVGERRVSKPPAPTSAVAAPTNPSKLRRESSRPLSAKSASFALDPPCVEPD